MAVIAKFICEVKPGRMADFMTRLKQAADPKFNSKVMPKSSRPFHSSSAEAEPTDASAHHHRVSQLT
jgi:hypothetical protein